MGPTTMWILTEAEHQLTTRLQSMIRDIAIVVVLTALTILACEGILRLANFPIQGRLTRLDQHRYYALQPNANDWSVGGEASQFVSINREGYRDSEHTLLHPGVRRIAFLGDSMTLALQVKVPETFPMVVQREMAGITGTAPDVMNFGVMGYSFLQCLFTLREDVWKYTPQDVVLVVTPSEIFHNTRATYWMERPSYPFFEYGNGRLVPDAETANHLSAPPPVNSHMSWRDRAEKFRLFNLWGTVEWRLTNKFSRQKKQEASVFKIHRFDASRPPDSPEMLEAWHVSEGLLDMLWEETRSHGARFWIAIVDSDAEAAPSAEFRDKFHRENRLNFPYYYETRVEDYGKKRGISTFQLAPEMRRFAVATNAVLHFDPGGGHWNVPGHRIVGKIIAQELTVPRGAVFAKCQPFSRVKPRSNNAHDMCAGNVITIAESPRATNGL
jgi:hypothetical protein